MDDSVQPACPESIFERPPAEMISSALGSIDDLSFDWHGFKDFLLNDKNFDTILNALQKDADHQSAVNQQQVHNKIHRGLTNIDWITICSTSVSHAKCNVINLIYFFY